MKHLQKKEFFLFKTLLITGVLLVLPLITFASGRVNSTTETQTFLSGDSNRPRVEIKNIQYIPRDNDVIWVEGEIAYIRESEAGKIVRDEHIKQQFVSCKGCYIGQKTTYFKKEYFKDELRYQPDKNVVFTKFSFRVEDGRSKESGVCAWYPVQSCSYSVDLSQNLGGDVKHRFTSKDGKFIDVRLVQDNVRFFFYPKVESSAEMNNKQVTESKYKTFDIIIEPEVSYDDLDIRNGEGSVVINAPLIYNKFYTAGAYIDIPKTIFDPNQEYQIQIEGKRFGFFFGFQKYEETPFYKFKVSDLEKEATAITTDQLSFSDIETTLSDDEKSFTFTTSLTRTDPAKDGQIITNMREGLTLRFSNKDGVNYSGGVIDLSNDKNTNGSLYSGMYGQPHRISKTVNFESLGLAGLVEGDVIQISFEYNGEQLTSKILEKTDAGLSDITDETMTIPRTIGGTVKLANPLKEGLDTIPKIATAIINGIVIPVTVPLLAIAIGYSGFLFISARGNPEKLKSAKEALKWTLIGAAIILGAWVIAQSIQTTIVDLIGSITNNWYA